MSVKKYYLDKRTLKSPTADGSLANLQNVLDLKDYIESVVDDSTTDFTSINVDTINESTTSHKVDFPDDIKVDVIAESTSAAGVTVDGVLLKDNNVTVGTAGAVITDTISEKTAATGVTVDSVLLKDGVVTCLTNTAGFMDSGGTLCAPLIPFGTTQQALSGAGAINLTSYYTAWTTTGANAGTLGLGTTRGQLKKITLVVDGGDGTLTTTFSSGSTITFNDAGDYVLLMWIGSQWVVLENSGCTIA